MEKYSPVPTCMTSILEKYTDLQPTLILIESELLVYSKIQFYFRLYYFQSYCHLVVVNIVIGCTVSLYSINISFHESFTSFSGPNL